MSLRDHLLRRIRAAGPMTVADWMHDCLVHPEWGYYVRRDPLGRDFTTAPEISQVFGELLGLALAQAWLDQGAPAPVTLAEPGPGRGTLMADALRATARVPGFHDALRLHLVEASPALRAEQAKRLGDHDPTWHDTVDALPDGPLLLVANEFLDALPVRQWRRAGDGWSEVLVTEREGALAFAAGPPALVPELDRFDVPDGTVVERCPALPGVVAAIARRVAEGGAAIFVDYGHWRSRGDTLQAVRAGAAVDPLADPGEADLTAHVDFEAVALAAGGVPGLRVSGMERQGVLLERLGATARVQALARGRDAAAVEALAAAHRRLLHPSEMGDLFKALALVPAGAPLPPGFGD
ncbi:class I SAM-dependent methyltransferase [Jannaschia sp. W003]|uniref:class I SAM-dependent methyltransferase n=1 Tax=Jannaschia sp. W003 TaxID=2867012 RepID=UPI0021A3BC0D|nr:SAM-dependent methyltransferase [Jannaschia sp. W003]UWQ22669.1 SAM-dependent methyltransferase [Jannaschia sp. W003]